MLLNVFAIIIITKKCYNIGRVKVSSTQTVLYCATSLSWFVCTLCVDVIVLNFNVSVMFVHCAWAPGDQIDVRLNIYI